jgi:L-rhamnose mutarotase
MTTTLKESAVEEYERAHRNPPPVVFEYSHKLGIRNVSLYRHGTSLVQVVEADDLEASQIGLDGDPRALEFIEEMRALMEAPSSESGGWTEAVEIYRWDSEAGLVIRP